MPGTAVGCALVRVTVASGARRADLALPATLPLAGLVPQLGERLLPEAAFPGGLDVVTPSGACLDPEQSLRSQGVEDGAVLVLVSAEEGDRPTYDDPAEAVGEALERGAPAWSPGCSRLAATTAAALLLGASAVALGWAAGAGTGVAAGVAAGVLVAAALLLSRLGATDGARVLAWAGVVHAAVAGVLLASAPGVPAPPGLWIVAGGSAAVAASLVCLVGLAGDRVALVPAALLGLVGLVGGGLAVAAPSAADTVAAGVLVAAAVAGGLAPRLAIGWVDLRGAWSGDPGRGPTGGAFEVGTRGLDPAAVDADALLAHRLVVAAELGLGLVVAVLSAVVATLGPAGAGLALCAAAVVALRSRRFRAAAPLAVTLGCGAAAAAASVGVVLASYPGARVPLAVAFLAAGLALSAGRATGRSPGWHRAADRVESCCVLALLPLLVAVSGVLGRVLDAVHAVAG